MMKVAIRSYYYTERQIEKIVNAQSARFSFATQIVAATGIRGSELLTLQRCNERPPTATNNKLDIKNVLGTAYTVKGIDSVIREIIIPAHLVEQLELLHLDKPRIVINRGVSHETTYNLAGGQRWSTSFTKASKRALGWTDGAHGLRQTYAKNRIYIIRQKYTHKTALEILSCELGVSIQSVNIYLR
ncbi:hypothetical protein C9J21_18195 [Photobacterium phosphoreum]|nr:hypothetical protein C9J21_18195 [Photobacterium phosphoreum]